MATSEKLEGNLLSPETAPTPETPPETEPAPEQPKETEEQPPDIEIPQEAATPQPTPESVPQKDELTMEVEGILEEGMGELYAELPDDAKPMFKQKGEEAARQISQIVHSAKIKASEILRLIRDWLHTIPKVNKFFLEQEAKIKTDRIIEVAETRKNEVV